MSKKSYTLVEINNLATKFDKFAQDSSVNYFPSEPQGVTGPYVPGTAPAAGYGVDQSAPTAPALHTVQLNAPAVKEQEKAKPKPAAAPKYDPEVVKTMQLFLSNSKALQGAIAQGQFSPLVIDGIFGPDTQRQLSYWGKANNIPARTVNDLVKALYQAEGAAKRPAPAQAASFADKLISLADKFEGKYGV